MPWPSGNGFGKSLATILGRGPVSQALPACREPAIFFINCFSFHFIFKIESSTVIHSHLEKIFIWNLFLHPTLDAYLTSVLNFMSKGSIVLLPENIVLYCQNIFQRGFQHCVICPSWEMMSKCGFTDDSNKQTNRIPRSRFTKENFKTSDFQPSQTIFYSNLLTHSKNMTLKIMTWHHTVLNSIITNLLSTITVESAPRAPEEAACSDDDIIMFSEVTNLDAPPASSVISPCTAELLAIPAPPAVVCSWKYSSVSCVSEEGIVSFLQNALEMVFKAVFNMSLICNCTLKYCFYVAYCEKMW